MNERRAAVIAQLTKLQCGLCLREGVEYIARATYALDRMQLMIIHWSSAHGASIVPAFTQDTWRTGIVYPLDYTPNLHMADGPTKHREESGHCAKCTYATKKLVPWPCESAQDIRRQSSGTHYE